MRLYLDDVRRTPDQFDVRTYTARETIEAISHGNISFVSLDFDLDGDGNLTHEECGDGYQVAAWIEQSAHDGILARIGWFVHSMNPAGALRIRQALVGADHAWDMWEFDPSI